jgi:hypothetical protein
MLSACLAEKVLWWKLFFQWYSAVQRFLDIMPYINVPKKKGPGLQNSSYDITEELTEAQEIKIFAKQLLVNRLFLGCYKERRFVESLGSYR